MAEGSQGDDASSSLEDDSTLTVVKSSAHRPLLPRSGGCSTAGRSRGVAPTSQALLRRFDYTALGMLGQGSYGGVHRAYSHKLGLDVAVKIICKAKVPRSYAEKFLIRELQVIRHLRHQNVIRHLEVIESLNRVYIVMELAKNGSLRDYLRRVKRVEEGAARRWFHHLVEGVSYLHNRGIVHRDLKCDNLLLNEQMVLKIADFGFARAHLPLETDAPRFHYDGPLSSTFCGSYAYASPELLTGTPYQPHLADIWSMGVILFFMTVGALPYEESNHAAFLRMVQEPIVFPKHVALTEKFRSLLRKIFVPASERAYLVEIKADPWYNSGPYRLYQNSVLYQRSQSMVPQRRCIY